MECMCKGDGMKVSLAKMELVIVGGWNPIIILNTNWLKRFVLPDENSFKVKVEINAGGTTTRVEAGDVQLALVGSRLLLSPIARSGVIDGKDTVKVLGKLGDMAVCFSDTLPHTPVAAYGVNFGMQVVDAKKGVTDISSLAGALFGGAEGVGGVNLQLAAPIKHGTMNVTVVESVVEASRVLTQLDYNFHREIGDLAALKEMISKCPLANDLRDASSKTDALLGYLE